MTVTQVDTGPRKVSRAVEVQAPGCELFDLVADPHRHGELDGSGTVRDTAEGATQLTEGAKSSVRMKQHGVPYRITSRVTDFADGRIVEWRHPMGHRWRWEFPPLTDTSTKVTETFDYSSLFGIQAKALEPLGMTKQNAAGIEATLRKLQARYRPV